MSDVKLVGWFPELGYNIPGQRSLRATLGTGPTADKAKIERYLADGWIVLTRFGEPARDVLASDTPEIGEHHALTDGEWAWPSDLVHYLRRYDVQLPDEFVDAMRRNSWEVPDLSRERADEIVEALAGARMEPEPKKE